MYTFFNFFTVGIYLAIFQIELFTAFLWLIECSVLFVMLLLFFFLNIKGSYTFLQKTNYNGLFIFLFFLTVVLINFSSESKTSLNLDFLATFDNYYEALNNNIGNDLFGFSISYYTLNSIEFLFIGLLLLFGSIICVNLHQFNRNVRSQNVSSSLHLFNFFTDFSSFFFLRRQNLTKQGNTKASLKIFKKK